MKFNKYKGFTLAELMVMLSVLTILLAAFAPVFTVRYNNASSENVWAFLGNDDNFNAYSDPVTKAITAQSFIGLTPANKAAVVKASSNANNLALYSKLVIRPSNKLTTGEQQKQIGFRYGSSVAGSAVGSLYADGTSILLGGDYKNVKLAANRNTSYGPGSLDAITTGTNNTALGYRAMVKLSTGSYNTAIGYKSAPSLTSGTGNTIIGNNAGSTRSSGDYNTLIGNYVGTKSGSYNTVVGDYAGFSNNSGGYNTALGYKSLYYTSGTGNTAVGPFAMSIKSSGSYNTAIGYNACSGVSGSYKTCVGYNSGNSTVNNQNTGLLTDSTERVYIGGKPVENVGGAAVLEVHNINSTNSGSEPRGSAGNSSVMINGNLVVRGQSYFGTARSGIAGNNPSLVGQKIYHVKDNPCSVYAFGGWDGSNRDTTTDESCGGRCKKHSEDRGKPNCVCTWGSQAGYKSYDWASNSPTPHDCMSNGNRVQNGTGYTDGSGFGWMGIDRNNINKAHPISGDSCCPKLKSDIRLKDLSGNFNAGLAEINRINVYNYTYKSDENKIPHVGVIAQDLKRVFPTAVTKDENGYYQIRWDEMLYAAINAIKTINSKVESLASRITKDQARIAALKKDNETLEQKVDVLTNELTLIEKKLK